MPNTDDARLAAFKAAGSDFCRVLLHERLTQDWQSELLGALAVLYASAHRLPRIFIHDDTPEIVNPERFEVGRAEYEALALRLKERFGAQDAYWNYLDSQGIDGLSEESVMRMLSEDLADIYCDIAPGLRALDHLGEEVLPAVVQSWGNPAFGSHWGAHAVAAMKVLHLLVYREH